jgi:hypothetical protein
MILKITHNGIHDHSCCSTIEQLCRRTLGSNLGLLQNWTDCLLRLIVLYYCLGLKLSPEAVQRLIQFSSMSLLINKSSCLKCSQVQYGTYLHSSSRPCSHEAEFINVQFR